MHVSCVILVDSAARKSAGVVFFDHLPPIHKVVDREKASEQWLS